MEDVYEIFNYGQDFDERMIEIIHTPFWQNVLEGLKMLFKSPVCNDLPLICSTPIWYNNVLRLPIKPSWPKKGIANISDVLNENSQLLSLDDFKNVYHISSNFLEYGGFAVTIKLFLDNREKPTANVTRILTDNCLVAMFDVASLYTNIPNDQGIQAARETLLNHRPILDKPSTDNLMILLEKVLKMRFESKFVSTYQQQPLLWVRFIDDIFVIWQHGLPAFKYFEDYLNQCVPSIKFETDISDT